MNDDLVHLVEVDSKGACGVHPDSWGSSQAPIPYAVCTCRHLKIAKFATSAIEKLTNIALTTNDSFAEKEAKEFLREHGAVL